MSDSVGSVSVDVVPDARGWAEKLRAQIRDQTVKVKADAETDEANAKLDEAARTRKAKIKAEVDKSALSQFDKFLGDMSALPALAIAAGAALIPLAGAIGGVVAALAAPLAIAGGGATLFGLLGGLAVKQTLDQAKAVDKLRGQVESARTSLENARRSAGKNASTSASVAAAQERLNKATADYQTALKGVSPQQAGFVKALDDLKLTFTDMLHGPTGRSILATLTDGVQLLTYVLRDAGPFIRASSKAFGEMLRELGQAVSSPGFSRFITMISRQVGPDLLAFGHILGNIGKGLGGLFDVAARGSFSHGLLDGLERLTHSFAEWGNSRAARRDVHEFFAYAHSVGPQVAHTIGAIASALGKVVEALAPLGPVVLKGIQLAANSLAAIPIPVLTALGAAFVSLVGFQKIGGFKALSALGRLGGGSAGGSAIGRLIGGGVQKVYVVNLPPGGITPDGKTPVVATTGKAKAAAEAAAAESDAIKAAKAAAEVVKAAGGDVAAQSAAAARAFKGAVTAAEATPALDFAIRGGLKGLLRTIVGGPIISNQETAGTPFSRAGLNRQFVNDFGGRKTLPSANTLKAFGITAPDARTLLNIPELKATASHFDAIRASAQGASRAIDLIGPHADHTFGAASKDVDAFRSKLAAIHDKQVQVILQDQAAVNQLEAIQRLRIADKNFNIYAHYQQIELARGPGGGAGQNPHGSGGGGSGSGGAGLTVHVHGHIDENGYVSGTAQRVYDDNQRFASAHG